MTFNPTPPQHSTLTQIDGTGLDGLTAVACPRADQCIAVDDNGREVTFNPAAPGSHTPISIDAAGGGLTSLACPISDRCIAVDDHGREVTFNPAAPGSHTPISIDEGDGGLAAVACPSADQ